MQPVHLLRVCISLSDDHLDDIQSCGLHYGFSRAGCPQDALEVSLNQSSSDTADEGKSKARTCGH